MTSNVDEMVKEAIKSYKGGNKPHARALLEKATEIDDHHEKAWMWLSAVVESVEDQRVCLQNVLVLNPDNTNAKRGLALLDEKSETTEAPAEPEKDPYDVPPTATSSASASYDPSSEISRDEYDNWITDLGIGQEQSSAPTDGPFTMEDDAYADMFTDAFDDDVFTEETFEQPVDVTEDDLRMGFDDEDFNDVYDTPVAEEEMDADALFDSLDDPFDGMEPEEEAQPVAATPAAMESAPSKRRDSGAFYEEADGSDVAENDPSYYFKAIPKDIKATRLPGTGGGLPVFSLLLVLLLIVGNIGAVVLLTMA